MIKINLLPVRAAKKKETIRQQISIAALSLVFTFIVIGYFHFNISRGLSGINAQIAETQAELTKTKAEIGEVSKFKEAKKVLEDKLRVIAALKKGKTGPVRVLDDLSKVTPETLWVNSFMERGGNVQIDGVAIDNGTIAQFMTELERSQYFKDIELIVTEQTELSGMKLKKFGLTGKLEGLELPKEEAKKK